jgi:hypothetical protein
MLGVNMQRAVDEVVLVSGSGSVLSTMSVVTTQATAPSARCRAVCNPNADMLT